MRVFLRGVTDREDSQSALSLSWALRLFRPCPSYASDLGHSVHDEVAHCRDGQSVPSELIPIASRSRWLERVRQPPNHGGQRHEEQAQVAPLGPATPLREKCAACADPVLRHLRLLRRAPSEFGALQQCIHRQYQRVKAVVTFFEQPVLNLASQLASS